MMQIKLSGNRRGQIILMIAPFAAAMNILNAGYQAPGR